MQHVNLLPNSGMQLSRSTNDEDWDAYVTAHANGTIYHQSSWRRAVENTFHKRSYYIVARDLQNRICGVLPLVRQSSRLFGDNLVSLPYCSFGGPLADDTETLRKLKGYALELSGELGCDSVQIRCDFDIDTDNWCERSDKVLMVLQLPPSAEELSKRLGSKIRSQIKRSARENPKIVRGGVDLLDDFYAVFCHNMRDLGTPVYPKKFFENVLTALDDHAHLVVVSIDGSPVAAAFLVSHRDNMEIPWASSLRSYSRMAVNMLLYWEALVLAVESGCRTFDFGRCTVGEGTYRFKKQWNAQPRQLYWQDYPGPGAEGPGRVAELARSIWQRLPLPVANRLGPLITSNLPW